MKLGLSIGYSGAELRLPVEKVLLAEKLGFDSVWTAEAYGSDAVTPLAYLAAVTKRIRLGTGIMQLAARPPAKKPSKTRSSLAQAHDRHRRIGFAHCALRAECAASPAAASSAARCGVVGDTKLIGGWSKCSLIDQRIKFGAGLLVHAGLLHVFRDADHREVGDLIERSKAGLQRLPDRIAILPERIHQCFVDDHNRTRHRIAGHERSPLHDRNAHRLEVVGHHCLVIVDILKWSFRRRGVIADVGIVGIQRAIGGVASHRADAFNTGHAAQPLQSAVETFARVAPAGDNPRPPARAGMSRVASDRNRHQPSTGCKPCESRGRRR